MLKIRDCFDDCYVKDPVSGCWLWSRSLAKGYGQVCYPVRQQVGAHIVSYERTYGRLKPGECVLHRCDVRRCVNPNHLFVGSMQDNAIDMARKGRQHVQKLSLADIAVIRADTRSQRVIARSYGVNQSQINRIKTRKRWAHA